MKKLSVILTWYLTSIINVSHACNDDLAVNHPNKTLSDKLMDIPGLERELSGGGCELVAGCTIAYYAYGIEPDTYINQFKQHQSLLSKVGNYLFGGRNEVSNQVFINLKMPVLERKYYSSDLGLLSKGLLGRYVKLNEDTFREIVSPLFSKIEGKPKAAKINLWQHTFGVVEYKQKYMILSDSIKKGGMETEFEYLRATSPNLSYLTEILDKGYYRYPILKITYFGS